jgi:EAL domain-containing protein (putative c-di-GMP-specific phosphodiesterase class I)
MMRGGRGGLTVAWSKHVSGGAVRLFQHQRSTPDERLLWSRDIRFVRRLADALPECRALELDSGAVLIGPASRLTDAAAATLARDDKAPDYGLVDVDTALPPADRYLTALSTAVQDSGLAARIGMAPSTQVVQTKTLDYFFSLRRLHGVAFQPIVELATGELHEYECLFRPEMPMLPQSISAIVQAALDTDRSVELDAFLIAVILERAGGLERARRARAEPSLRLAVNVTPASLLDARFEAGTLAAMVGGHGLSPAQITLECTEQQAVEDVVPLKRAVKALRRAGFGFAVDDAGAGYASFALIAALRPTVIKIDREIVAGIARDDAKQALVEAFVSFGRRIGARLLAEGIERRTDLAMVTALGVDLGQGYLLGRPAAEPAAPRAIESLRLDATRVTVHRAVHGRITQARIGGPRRAGVRAPLHATD